MIHMQRTRLIDQTTDDIWGVLGRYMHIDEFAPSITSVEALSDGKDGCGSRRRNIFENGTSVVEEVTEWNPGEGYTVKLSDMGSMPLKKAQSQVSVFREQGRSRLVWTFDFHPKFGPFGWLLGQLMMKKMMAKIIDAYLKGLADTVDARTRSVAQS